MTDSYRKTLADVDLILSQLDESIRTQVPRAFRSFIHENKLPADVYTPEVRTDLPLEQQTLRPETTAFLALLYGCYWTENSAELEALIAQTRANDGGIGTTEESRAAYEEILKLFPKDEN